ncbi:MAG: putative superfamily transporter inner rane protein [Chloroflexi bacterium]|nr:putative superfamily transporter inner rane protein [Chloroflexota bacterium]
MFSTPSSPSIKPRRAAVWLVLAAAAWGLGTVISKRAVEEIPPLSLLVIQLTISVVALWIGRGLVGRGLFGRGLFGRASDPADRPADSAALDRLGLLNPGASYALSLVGLTGITASLSVLLWAIEPVLILAIAWWWLREPVTPRLVVLSATAVAGMALVVWSPGLGGQVVAILATVAGIACCAVYTVLARRRIGDVPSTLRIVLGQQAWALGFAALLLGASVLVDGVLGGTDAAGIGYSAMFTVTAPISVEAWASAVVSGVVYYALAYVFYLSGLRHVPASRAAAAFYLIPLFGVAGGVALLGDRLDPGQWLGAVVIVASVVAIARSGSTPKAAPAR